MKAIAAGILLLICLALAVKAAPAEEKNEADVDIKREINVASDNPLADDADPVNEENDREKRGLYDYYRNNYYGYRPHRRRGKGGRDRSDSSNGYHDGSDSSSNGYHDGSDSSTSKKSRSKSDSSNGRKGKYYGYYNGGYYGDKSDSSDGSKSDSSYGSKSDSSSSNGKKRKGGYNNYYYYRHGKRGGDRSDSS